MERLGSAEHGGQGLVSNPDDVVLRLLGGQAAAGRLGVEAEHQRFGVFGPNRSFMIRAQRRRAARNLATSSRKSRWELKKKDNRGAKASTSSPCFQGRLDVGDSVGQGEGDFLNRRRAGLADVIAGDGDGVPAGHFLGTVLEDVGNDPHRRPRREDVGPPGRRTP